MKIDLSGRTAIVTGSTAGIGRATAEGLARAGASVIVNGRTQARVDQAVQQMRAAFPECGISGIAADLATAEGANAFKQENRSPAFLELNPLEKVPVLKTGDAALYESVAIIAFLDRAHPAVPLFGKTAQEHGRIWQRVCEFENYTRDLFDVEIVRPLLGGYAKDDPAAMRTSATRVYDALGWMEQALSVAPYLAGEDITAADIVALPNIQMLRRVAVRPDAIEMALGLEDLGAGLPALGAWLSRMETMRGYNASYPPHWRG